MEHIALPAIATASPRALGAIVAAPATDHEHPLFRDMDRSFAAAIGAFTFGLSPSALLLAAVDWSVHLGIAPGKRAELATRTFREATSAWRQALAGLVDPQAATPAGQSARDPRFSSEAWSSWPFSAFARSFLTAERWWDAATHDVPGVSPHHEDVVAFAARQLLDMMSPSNIAACNPDVVRKTLATGGMNFVAGYRNWLEDTARMVAARAPVGADSYLPGRDVATTPGSVVFRNELIELIQYAPTTGDVAAEPILIVPAWIMKYYILDLSPQNSLIRYLVSSGFTVFCISWRNPVAADRDLAFDDYRRAGVMEALDAIARILPGRRVHATGYCLGGTLLAVAAAAMAHAGDQRLASVTLLASQTDFSEPGELALFIDHSQMNMLDGMMWSRGYLSADQMAGAFQLLRSVDLIWSRLVYEYLMGERSPMTDLMAWNADTTRMPYRMQAEYLQRLYLDNELAAGRFLVEGHPAALQNIRAPVFLVGAERDHVAPWQSVFKLHYLADTDITFVLTNGGHNAGIVSEPGHKGRHYRLGLKREMDMYHGPDEWVAMHAPVPGSWWPAWVDWLAAGSSATRMAPPPVPELVYDAAPGTYVFAK